MNCDQCEAAMINGHFCHETGCPNERKTYVPEREAWIRFIDCHECGCPVEQGESCGCSEPMEDEETQRDEEFADE